MEFKTKVVFGILLITLIFSTSLYLVIASEGKNKSDIKNYGTCVANATKQKFVCMSSERAFYYDCLKNAWNVGQKNMTLIKKNIKKCNEDKKNGLDFCEDKFKDSKEDCLIFKCDYNVTDKTYVSKKPSECKNLNYTCNVNSEKFKDDCGCGCKLKKKPEKTCNEIKDGIKEELKQIQKCNTDSDCAVGNPGLPCSISLCSTAYNNNSNLSLITDLSKVYINNCRDICPMIACMNPVNQKSICKNHECKIKNIEPNQSDQSDKNYCTPEQKNATICPTLYNPVCGWFNSDIRCMKYPCAQKFSNSCIACANKNVEYWTAGDCPNQPCVGCDKDSHGCIASAGYTWCQEKQKCLRTWEESC